MSTIYEYANPTFSFHYSLDKNPINSNLLHAHDANEIYYFLSGEGTFSIEGNEYPLESGNILIMRPGETHKLSISPKKPYERIVINFPSELTRVIDPKNKLTRAFNDRPLGQLNMFNSNNINSAFILECFMEMISHSDENYEKSLSIIANLYPILSEINKSYQKIRQKNPPHVNKGIIREIIDFINSNIYGNLSLEIITEKFFISKSQLNRRFKQTTGSTVWEYITIKRLLASRQLIRYGRSAGDACEACGFHDYTAFYRAYKNYFSVSPQNDRPLK